MTQTCAMERLHRPWWKRRVSWLIGIAAVAMILLVGIAVEESGKPVRMPYSAFLDQLEAGNVANVMFQGTEIDGRFKHPLDNAGGMASGDTFSSRVPDIGDPTLVQELRKQHVVIDVNVPSAWTWLLGRIPWPMMLFVGAMLIAGIVRLMRGGKTPSGAAGPMPMHGIMGFVSSLFGKEQQTASPPAPDHDTPKAR